MVSPRPRLISPSEQWSEVRRIAREEANRAKLRIATVTGVSGGMASIRIQGADSGGGALLSRIAGGRIDVGQTVYVTETTGGQFIVLGPDAPETYEDFALPYNQVPWMRWRSGRSYTLRDQLAFGGLTDFLVTAHRVYYVPIYYPGDSAIDAGIFEITVAAAGGTSAAMGFYECTENVAPGAAIARSAKSVQTSVGFKTMDFVDFVPPPQRWYFIAFAHTGTPSIRGTTDPSMPSVLGSGTTTMSPFTIYREDLDPSWTTLPDSASPSITGLQYVNIGVVTV